MKSFHNVDGMPDLAAFMEQIIHIHSAEVPALRDEGFVRKALQSFLLKAFPKSEGTLQIQFDNLVISIMLSYL